MGNLSESVEEPEPSADAAGADLLPWELDWTEPQSGTGDWCQDLTLCHVAERIAEHLEQPFDRVCDCISRMWLNLCGLLDSPQGWALICQSIAQSLGVEAPLLPTPVH